VTITALLDLTLAREAVADAPAIIHRTLAATRAFAGCLKVEVLVDADDETHVVLLEQWDSIDSDLAYRAWRATPEGASGLRGILAQSPRLTRFTAAAGV